MIPTAHEAKQLWETYDLPEAKRVHSLWVSRLAVWFARELMRKDTSVRIAIPLLAAAALVHDIDKSIPKLPGERHPDTAVRVLLAAGYDEVANLVRTHPLHTILDRGTAPNTWEEKLLYLSDKMVKHTVMTVDERFALWRAEHLPPRAVAELDAAYPLVKSLEREICTRLDMTPDTIVRVLQDTGN